MWDEYLTEGTLLGGVYTYRTKNGLHLYQFDYIQENSYWIVQIISQESYEELDASFTTTHRIQDKLGRVFIKFKEPERVNTLPKAQTLSIFWAEATTSYILTGKTIDKQITNQQTNNENQSN